MRRPPLAALRALVAIGALVSALDAQDVLPETESPPVREVRFEGAEWISRELLLDALALGVGEPYSPERVAAGMEAVLALRAVAALPSPRLEPFEDGVAVVFDVEGRLAVRGIAFQGNSALDAASLGEGLRTAAGELLDAADLERDRAGILERYLNEGFLLAEVDAHVRPVADAPGVATVEFAIEEGHRVSIRTIRVEGNEQVPTSHILGAMRHRRRLLFGILARGEYNPRLFLDDLERVEELYRNRGYLDALVAHGGVRFDDELRSVELTVLVEEGRRYRIEALELGGNTPALHRGLKFQIRSRPGDWYDGKLLEEDRRRLQEFYERRTFRVPRIELSHFFKESEDDARVRVSFDIDERDWLFAGRVDVQGNHFTRERVIRQRSTVLPAGPLTRVGLQDTANAVQGLGFFSSVDVRATRGRVEALREETEIGTNDEARPTDDVAVTVVEKQDGLFEIGGGASSGEGEIFAVKLTKLNFDIFDVPGGARGWERPFSGGGQLLQVEVYPGTRVSEFRFLFEDPYLYNSDHKLSLAGTNQIYRWRKLDETHLRGELGVRRIVDPERRLSARLSWVLEDVRLDDLEANVPANVREYEGHTLFSYPSLLLAYADAESNGYSGARGLQAWTRLDLGSDATGSETEFVRSTTSFDHGIDMNPVWNRVFSTEVFDEDNRDVAHTLRLRGTFGWLKDIAGDETPYYQRFLPGGPRSFRGFEYRGLGARENGISLGGDAYWFGSVEYSFPLVIRELRAVALLDFGDLEESTSGFAANRVRTAAGGGLEIRVPFLGQNLPLNLYWVEALAKEPEDRERFFSLTFGLWF